MAVVALEQASDLFGATGRLIPRKLFTGKAQGQSPGAIINLYLESIRSSGLCKKSLPRPLVKMPSRCHSLRTRLTVNGVTFAPAARSSFPILISTPSRQALPIPQARLSNRLAMRPLASSDIKEILAEIAHAMCSVTAMESAFSSNIGKRDTNCRMVFLSHANTQLPESTSVLTRYWQGAAKIVTPPKNCPTVNQCRMIFRPPLVITNCLPWPLVMRNIRSAGSSR
jgi:hypothetical protein